MLDFERSVDIAIRSDACVLISGATGSGKTSLARRIHASGNRRQGPLITINLATLHEGVLESELFGHERGAFTGADARRVGKLELAHGGTVFLDEIGDLSLRLQARLLEVLQSGMITPVGGNREMKLDLRVIAATHRDLDAAVRAGTFREDLLHRLRVIPVHLPSLSEKSEQFDEILHGSLAEVCAESKRSILGVCEGVATILEAYGWPGNYRELRNVLSYAVASAAGETIEVRDLPYWLLKNQAASAEVRAPEALPRPRIGFGKFEMNMPASYEEALRIFEKEYFGRVFTRFQWRLTRAARATGTSKATLIRRARALGLRPANDLEDDFEQLSSSRAGDCIDMKSKDILYCAGPLSSALERLA